MLEKIRLTCCAAIIVMGSQSSSKRDDQLCLVPLRETMVNSLTQLDPLSCFDQNSSNLTQKMRRSISLRRANGIATPPGYRSGGSSPALSGGVSPISSSTLPALTGSPVSSDSQPRKRSLVARGSGTSTSSKSDSPVSSPNRLSVGLKSASTTPESPMKTPQVPARPKTASTPEPSVTSPPSIEIAHGPSAGVVSMDFKPKKVTKKKKGQGKSSASSSSSSLRSSQSKSKKKKSDDSTTSSSNHLSAKKKSSLQLSPTSPISRGRSSSATGKSGSSLRPKTPSGRHRRKKSSGDIKSVPSLRKAKSSQDTGGSLHGRSKSSTRRVRGRDKDRKQSSGVPNIRRSKSGLDKSSSGSGSGSGRTRKRAKTDSVDSTAMKVRSKSSTAKSSSRSKSKGRKGKSKSKKDVTRVSKKSSESHEASDGDDEQMNDEDDNNDSQNILAVHHSLADSTEFVHSEYEADYTIDGTEYGELLRGRVDGVAEDGSGAADIVTDEDEKEFEMISRHRDDYEISADSLLGVSSEFRQKARLQKLSLIDESRFKGVSHGSASLLLSETQSINHFSAVATPTREPKQTIKDTDTPRTSITEISGDESLMVHPPMDDRSLARAGSSSSSARSADSFTDVLDEYAGAIADDDDPLSTYPDTLVVVSVPLGPPPPTRITDESSKKVEHSEIIIVKSTPESQQSRMSVDESPHINDDDIDDDSCLSAAKTVSPEEEEDGDDRAGVDDERRDATDTATTLAVGSVVNTTSDETWTYAELMNDKQLGNPKKREQHLSDEEFEKIFSMSKHDFYLLKAWQQRQLKVKTKLF